MPWVSGSGAGQTAGSRSTGERRRRLDHRLPATIGGLLPVYVEDATRASASSFRRSHDDELATTSRTTSRRSAMSPSRGRDRRRAREPPRHGAADLRARGPRYAAKVHGSALSYTVSPHPRFLPYASEGLEGAKAVLVGSRHTAEALLELTGVDAETRLGARRPRPPPRAPGRRHRPLSPSGRADRRHSARAFGASAKLPAGPFGRDPAAAARALADLAAADGPRALFVGKLIPQKGVDLLLAAWPLVHAEYPARGSAWSASASLEVGSPGPPATCGGSIVFAGRLEHDEVAELVGCAAHGRA